DHAALRGRVGGLADLALERRDRGGVDDHAALAVVQRLGLAHRPRRDADHVEGADQVDLDHLGEHGEIVRAGLGDGAGGPADAGADADAPPRPDAPPVTMAVCPLTFIDPSLVAPLLACRPLLPSRPARHTCWAMSDEQIVRQSFWTKARQTLGRIPFSEDA